MNEERGYDTADLEMAADIIVECYLESILPLVEGTTQETRYRQGAVLFRQVVLDSEQFKRSLPEIKHAAEARGVPLADVLRRHFGSQVSTNVARTGLLKRMVGL